MPVVAMAIGLLLGAEPGCGNGWFGSVGGLMLTRDRSNGFWTTYESTTNANQIMNTEDANARLGRWLDDLFRQMVWRLLRSLR